MQEGFFESQEGAYNSLKNLIKSKMTPYCELAGFIEGRMKKIYMTNKFTDSGTSIPGDSEAEANARIQQTYKQVYSCTDELADSRPSCSKYKTLKAIKGFFKRNQSEEHTPCSAFLNLPIYSEDAVDSITDELSKIPDNLAYTISKEVEWYISVMNELQKGLDAGANPPAQAKTGPNAPATYEGQNFDADGKEIKKKKEPFVDKCSPEAARLRRERDRQRRRQKESTRCIMPDLPSEISRVRKIINSKALKDVISKSNSLLARARKIQSDLQKLEAGTLYDWQQFDKGPKKSYSSFKGGDRSASFVFSLQQNR